MDLITLVRGTYVGATAVGALAQRKSHYVEMPLKEKVALSGSLLLGIDSLIASYFTGGPSLHESLGVSLGDYSQMVQMAEILGAYAGTMYLNGKVIKRILDAKNSEDESL